MTEKEYEEVDLFDYLNIILKHRRMIVRNIFVAVFVMAVISFFLPKTYTATTTLLPPDESSKNGLRGLLSNSPAAMLDIPGMPASSSEIFVEILKSRTVTQGVLATKYKYQGREKTLFEFLSGSNKTKAFDKLKERTVISANEQGVIQIDVELSSPQLAAQVARQYVACLDQVNQAKSLSRAKNSRIYIEQQLEVTNKNLKDAAQALADFQGKFKAVNLEEQTRVAIEKAGEIKGTIMAKEVELEVARQTMKKGNPVILRFQKELDELKKQFDHLQFGNTVPPGEKKDYFIPFSDVPEIGLQYAELIREVKVQETVWQLLNQQYYSAKIQEARDTPTVQVLDEAVPPEKRTSPKRKLILLVTAFLTFAFSIIGAFVMEFAEKIKTREMQSHKVHGMVSELKKDIRDLKQFVNRYLKKSK